MTLGFVGVDSGRESSASPAMLELRCTSRPSGVTSEFASPEDFLAVPAVSEMPSGCGHPSPAPVLGRRWALLPGADLWALGVIMCQVLARAAAVPTPTIAPPLRSDLSASSPTDWATLLEHVRVHMAEQWSAWLTNPVFVPLRPFADLALLCFGASRLDGSRVAAVEQRLRCMLVVDSDEFSGCLATLGRGFGAIDIPLAFPRQPECCGLGEVDGSRA